MLSDSSKPKKPRLTRTEFLARALDVLAKEGESELRIDRLVEALSVTKGSFYWHFVNRADFVQSLALYWEQWSTDRVVEEIGPIDDSPRAKLLRIHEIVTRDDLVRYDLVMRSWAAHEPKVADIVRSVDRTRFEFVLEQFRQLGYVGNDLDIRTRTFVVTTSLWTVINRHASRKKRLQQLASVLDLLTSP